MRELISLFLPIAAVVFVIAYLLLINPNLLIEFGYWLQKIF
jgi:hypothetical protein